MREHCGMLAAVLSSITRLKFRYSPIPRSVSVRVLVLINPSTVIVKGAVGARPLAFGVKLIGMVIVDAGWITTFSVPVTAYGEEVEEFKVGHETVRSPRPAFLIVSIEVTVPPPVGPRITKAAGATNRPSNPRPLNVTLKNGFTASLLVITKVAALVVLLVPGVKVTISCK